MSDSAHPVIGIDLGTTYSAVAVYNRFSEKAEIIPNREYTAQTTPSVISVDSTTHVVTVGWPALRNLPNDPENTVIEIKRL